MLPRGNEHILFVDDEKTVVNIGIDYLVDLGYTVEGSTDSCEAFKLIKQHKDRYDLIVTDITMPTMTGDLLLRKIKALNPKIPVILCSGFCEQIDDATAKSIGAVALITKPLTQRVLAETVRKALDEKNIS